MGVPLWSLVLATHHAYPSVPPRHVSVPCHLWSRRVKRLLFLVAVLSLTVGAWSVSAATPNVGQHIHALVANHPIKGKVIPRAPWTFQVTVQLHDMPAKATLFRVSDYN